MATCPSDFETTPGQGCRMKCPTGFRYVAERGGQGCMSLVNEQYRIPLITAFTEAERTRARAEFESAFAALQARMQRDRPSATNQQMEDAAQENAALVSRIESTAANVRSMREVSDSLTPFRPPTQPSSDIEKERKIILARRGTMDLLVVQIALLIVSLCLIVYLILPASIAHYIAFLILSVGIAVGIFLSN